MMHEKRVLKRDQHLNMCATFPDRGRDDVSATTLADAPTDSALERLTRLAARLLDAPLAIVSLADGAHHVVAASYTRPDHPHLDDVPRRAQTFCRDVVRQGRPLIVHPDDRRSRVGDAGDQHTLTFAGVPLRATDGEILGTLCVASDAARRWSDAELETLADLAAAASAEVELRRTTRYLHAREEQFIALLDQINDLVCSTNEGGEIDYVNEAWERTLGYTPEEARQLRPVDLIAPEHRGRYVEASRKLLRGEAIAGLELVLVARDGRRRVVRGSAEAIMKDGVCIRTRLVYRDLTRERQNEALHARLVATIEATPDLVAITTRTGELLYLNRSGKALIGLPEDADVKSVRLADFFAESQYDRVTRDVIPTALRDGAWQGETTLRVRSGDEIPVSQVLVAHPSVRDDDTSPYFLSMIIRDLRGRMRHEAKLRERESRFRRILESVRAPAALIDPSGHVAFANTYLLELVGLTAEEAVGAPWIGRFVPDDAGSPMTPDAISAGDIPPHTEVQLLARGGERRVIAWDNVVLRDDDGRVAGVARIGQDVTDQRHVEELKDQVIAIVGHELRSPIGAVRGALQVLSRRLGDIGAQERQLFDMAVRNADRLLRLVNDLLDYERLTGNAVTLDRSVVRASAVLDQALDVVAVAAEAAGVRLETQSESADIWADQGRIVQVLVNFLSNAIKFSPEGATVRLEAFRRENDVVFRVHDQGRGIPADKLEAVFDRFTQVHTSDARRGSGLGLAIARAIVRQHSGQIWAESTVGSGSTFAFSLPVPELALVSEG
jgi:PAS domain S-box-containing protein